MRIEKHPKLNIWVREDGCIYLPQSGTNPAHWTFGSLDKKTGYLKVRVGGKLFSVHRLVVEAYLGKIPEGCEVDHISRVRHDNRLDNLHIVTHSQNNRNTRANDRVTERGGTHAYEDKRQYNHEWYARNKAKNPDKVREQAARYRAENPDKVREQNARYYQSKRKTQRHVRFSDGSLHWIPNEQAVLLLAIPLNERIFKE